eukprot:5049114-Pleurochrysis_carterae.AAC.1
MKAHSRECHMKFKFLHVMLTFLLHNLWIDNAGAYQAGLERCHGCTLKLPALWLAELHVEPEWALCALLHSGFLAQKADHVADVRGAAIMVRQHVESGRFAVHQIVHFVGNVDGHRDGAVHL